MYVIANEKNTEYWSNEDGWVDISSATRFSKADTKVFHLPTDGHWVTFWEVNSLQFARFIAECEAAGVFCDSERMLLVADSMDLDTDEVFEIVSRAQKFWDDYKATM
jgi:hypothetical protein